MDPKASVLTTRWPQRLTVGIKIYWIWYLFESVVWAIVCLTWTLHGFCSSWAFCACYPHVDERVDRHSTVRDETSKTHLSFMQSRIYYSFCTDYGYRLVWISSRYSELTVRLRSYLCCCFVVVHNVVQLINSTRGRAYKLFQRHYSQLDTRKHFFAERIIKPKNSLPANNDIFYSLTIFKSFVNSVN